MYTNYKISLKQYQFASDFTPKFIILMVEFNGFTHKGIITYQKTYIISK